jgi:release factor glutamine methyltransferase
MGIMKSQPTLSVALASSGLVPVDARMLLAHVLGHDRAWLIAHRNTRLTADQARRFDALVRRRHNGEPVAYLIGRREFYGLELEITADVLIPRPETELLVEVALESILSDASARVLDLGTGSGAVALAIAWSRRRAAVVGTDVSVAALALAQRNAQRLLITNATFIASDWFADVPCDTFDVIVANPPYIDEHDRHLHEGDLRFEPRGALTPGGNGLAAIRAISHAARAFLARAGRIAIEHGYDQADAAQECLREAGFADVSTRRDLAGIPRVTVGRAD